MVVEDLTDRHKSVVKRLKWSVVHSLVKCGHKRGKAICALNFVLARAVESHEQRGHPIEIHASPDAAAVISDISPTALGAIVEQQVEQPVYVVLEEMDERCWFIVTEAHQTAALAA